MHTTGAGIRLQLVVAGTRSVATGATADLLLTMSTSKPRQLDESQVSHVRQEAERENLHIYSGS
jgi:hypothetical protein